MGLKELLHQNNMSMYRLAKEAKIGQATVCEIANGKRKAITVQTASKIAEVLGVDIEVIQKCIGGENNANKNRNSKR
jgi:transcriptional regulator with XRE-family HTH domain